MSLEPQPPDAGRLLSPEAPPHVRASALLGVRHGFFGKRGGVSTGIYESLNAGTGSHDDPEATRENRRRIAAAFGAPLENLIGVHQVHSPEAVFVDGPWPGGERPHADALVTKTPGLVLSVLTADCAPVLLADLEACVIGAAHAGWRGALGGVLQATVRRMTEKGAATSRIVAAIGPCIQCDSYLVRSDLYDRFLAADPQNKRFFTTMHQANQWGFDLPGYCAFRLRALGVGHVHDLGHDTRPEGSDYFSNRRSVHQGHSDYGRNCSAIALG